MERKLMNANYEVAGRLDINGEVNFKNGGTKKFRVESGAILPTLGAIPTPQNLLLISEEGRIFYDTLNKTFHMVKKNATNTSFVWVRIDNPSLSPYIEAGSPVTLDTASAGSVDFYSRGDHTHKLPTHTHITDDNGGLLDHGQAMIAASLLDDDHPNYILKNGTKSFTGPVKGVLGTLDDHLVTYGQLKTSMQGIAGKKSVRVTANIILDLKDESETNPINYILMYGLSDGKLDGEALILGDRVLIKDQTDNTNANGIYKVTTVWTINNNGELSRDTDADSIEELVSAFVFVEEGTNMHDTGWLCTIDKNATWADEIKWIQFSSAGHYSCANLMEDDEELGIFGIFKEPEPADSVNEFEFKSLKRGAYTTLAKDGDYILIDVDVSKLTADALPITIPVKEVSSFTTIGSSASPIEINHGFGIKYVTLTIFDALGSVVDFDVRKTDEKFIIQSVGYGIGGTYTLVAIG